MNREILKKIFYEQFSSYKDSYDYEIKKAQRTKLTFLLIILFAFIFFIFSMFLMIRTNGNFQENILSCKFLFIFSFIAIPLVIFLFIRKKTHIEPMNRYIVKRKIFETPGINIFFDNKGFVAEEKIHKSRLFIGNSIFNKVSGKNLLSKDFDGIKFQMSDMRIDVQIDKDNDKVLFEGIFGVIYLEKKINNNILLIHDKIERILGRFAKDVQEKFGKEFGELILLENPEFERDFAVYCNDQVEARRFLTLDFMEYMVQLNKKIEGNINFSIIDNIIYFKIDKSSIFEEGEFLDIFKNHYRFLRYFNKCIILFDFIKEINRHIKNID